MLNDLKNAFKDAQEALTKFYQLEANLLTIQAIATGIAKAFKSGNKVLICGNGGSACDAMHFAEEFTGRYRSDRKALPAIHLGDAGHLTCVGNDYGFEEVFARGVEAYGTAGDWFIGLSTSGNSENVIRALSKAQSQGLHTVSLLGKTGGRALGRAEHELIAPGATADRIQEVHMCVLHIIIEMVERVMFPECYTAQEKVS